MPFTSPVHHRPGSLQRPNESVTSTAFGTPGFRPGPGAGARLAAVEGLSRRHADERLALTASDHAHRPRTEAFPCASDVSDSGDETSGGPAFTPHEQAPYRQLEQTYASIFNAPGISDVQDRAPGAPALDARRTLDVDLDECRAVNLARSGYDAIGTTSLSSCIAICARGTTDQGETVLGLSHYTGTQPGLEQPRQALQQLRTTMEGQGATRNSISVQLVGGMMSRDPSLDTLSTERAFLALHREFNIQGARLHLSQSTGLYDGGYVNAVLTANHLHFGTDELYDPYGSGDEHGR